MKKRVLSLLLAVAMVVSMLPVTAFAAEYAVGETTTTTDGNPPAKQDQAVWVQDGKPVTNVDFKKCQVLVEHTHGVDCSYLGCDHYPNGHDINTCYGESTTTWEVCENPETHKHTATKAGSEVYTDGDLRDLWWPIYKAASDKAEDEWDEDAWIKQNPKPSGLFAFLEWEGKKAAAKTAAGIEAGAAAVSAVTFCYTTTAPLICGHGDTCTDACCRKTEHTHTDACKTTTWTWKLYADVNGNDEADDSETKYTVVYSDGVAEEAFEDQTFTERLVDTATPAFVGEPTREGYLFAGWTPTVAEKIVAPAQGLVITYTATWNVNANGNEYPDKDETYTVIYKGLDDAGKEKTYQTFKDLSYNASTPVISAPTRTNFTFVKWNPAVAENVTAPSSGNEIVYVAEWKENGKVNVLFMDGETTLNDLTQTIYENSIAQEPSALSKDGYLFLGWVDEQGKMFDFANTKIDVDLTLYAKWADDANSNGVDDATEKYTVIYMTVNDQEYEKFDNLNRGDETPSVTTNPEREYYVFDGWKPVVAETIVTPTEEDSTTIIYEAQWKPQSDVNTNEVPDQLETLTVVVTGTGAVTVNGSEDATVVYDSTGDKTITIVADPADGSYVAEIAVQGLERSTGMPLDLTFDNKYNATATFVANGTHTITVTFKKAEFVFKDDYSGNGANDAERVMEFNPFTASSITEADVYGAVVSTPSLEDATSYIVKYKAREADASLKIDLSDYLDATDTTQSLILNALKAVNMSVLEIPMSELWLEVGDPNAGADDTADAVISRHLGNLSEKLKEIYEENNTGLLGSISAANAVVKEITEISKNLVEDAAYVGTRTFGYNDDGADVFVEALKITYNCAAYSIAETETDVTLIDKRIPTEIVCENLQVMYKNYNAEELFDQLGLQVKDNADNVISNAEVTYDVKLIGKAAGQYDVIFKFSGNEEYKPSSATFTVTVTKATGKMDIPNVTITYGDTPNLDPVYTLDNQYGEGQEITDSLIRFVVGLDVANVDLDENNKITGLDTRVQLLLPESLNELLDNEYVKPILERLGIDLSEGSEIKLDQLDELLDGLKELGQIVDIGNNSVDFLGQALDAIANIAGAGDITIVIGGTYPEDIGIYLVGAVTTNPNYTTAMDVGYVVITPKAEQVYLDWDHKDENGIFTWDLLNNPDFKIGASAYNDEAFTEKNEDATEDVHSLFFGVDETGNLVLSLDEIEGADQLSNGAFVQLAFIAEFGNEFYYAVPIARPFIVTPNLVDVKFEDQNDNNAFLFTYDGDPKPVSVIVKVDNETIEPAEGELTVTYYGVSTNGETLNGTAAPVHTGAYTAVATYVAKDDKGEVKLVGGAVAAIVIQPAQADITVDNATVTWSGDPYDVESLIKVENALDDEVKYTVITAQLNSEGDVSENGLAGIRGKVNVDFPEKLDTILEQNELLAAGYTEEGINASVLIDALKKAEGLGSETVDRLVEVLEQLPDTAKVTFHDEAKVSSVGIYLVMGIITDPDYLPAMDFGVLIIEPKIVEGELQFNYEDSNNIFTQALLADMKANGTTDLNAHYRENNEKNDEITGLVKNLFIGTDAYGMPVTTDDWTTLTNGVYLQVSYVETELGSTMYVAKPISRTITIVPSKAEVTLVDAVDGVVTGNCKETEVKVTVIVNDQEIQPAEGEVTITYTGVDANGEPWSSTKIPEVAGEYGVVATFVRYNADGSLYAFGGTVGKLVIEHKHDELRRNYAYHWYVCACSDVSGMEPHTYGDWNTVQYPTTWSAGIKCRECTLCGDVQEAPIPKLSIEVEPNVNDPIITLKYLNDMDHVAYIKGYEDATIRPNNTITRAEVATIFYRLMTDEARSIFETEVNGFSDVNAKDWFNVAVSTLANADIIQDVKNGKFRPNEPITRGELFMMAAQFLQMTGGKLPVIYIPDVADDYWAAEEIKLLVYAGLLKGYEDGTIRPDNTLTRAEAITVINRMLKRAITEEALPEVMVSFKDCTVADWFYEAVQEAVNGHDYIRSTDKVEGYDFHYEIWTAVK